MSFSFGAPGKENAPAAATGGGFSFGAPKAKDDAGGSSDAPPSAPKGGMPGGFSLAGGPTLDAGKAKETAPTKEAAGGSAKDGGAGGGFSLSAPKAKAASSSTGGFSLAPAGGDKSAAAPKATFSLQPAAGGAGAASSALVPAGGQGLPTAPDLVGADNVGPGEASHRGLLALLCSGGSAAAEALRKPSIQKRLEELTAIYTGPPVTADYNGDPAAAAGGATCTAELRKGSGIHAYIVSGASARKKVSAESDGREDGWIETLSALTNLHQKQAFQLWQLFSETMLEDDHAAYRPSGSRELRLSRAIMPSTVEEMRVVKEALVAAGSAQSGADLLQFYLGERLDLIRCAIVALSPQADPPQVSPRKLLHTALYILAEISADRGADSSEYSTTEGRRWDGAWTAQHGQVLAEAPHLAGKERALWLPVAQSNRARVDPQLRDRAPRQQQEEELLLLQLTLRALIAERSDEPHASRGLEMLLELCGSHTFRAVPPERRCFGTMLRCLVVIQWLHVDDNRGPCSQRTGAKIEESLHQLCQPRLVALSRGAAADFCEDGLPAIASLAWALLSLRQMMEARQLCRSITVEMDVLDDADAGSQSPRLNTDFVRLVDKTKRQRQMKRPLTPEEKELVRAAVAVGVPADTLSESELLTFDCAGEWVSPNPKRKIKRELEALAEDFDLFFNKSMNRAQDLGANDALAQLVGLSDTSDEALSAGVFKDVLWRFLLSWTDPDVVHVERQAPFLALLPRLLRGAQRPPERGPLDITRADCSCALAGDELQSAVRELLTAIGDGEGGSLGDSRTASRLLHFVRTALEAFGAHSSRLVDLLGGMAAGSDAPPVIVDEILCTIAVPLSATDAALTIDVGRQRACALAATGGTVPMRVLLVHQVIWCCEQIRRAAAQSGRLRTESVPPLPMLRSWLELLVAVYRDGVGGGADDWRGLLEETAATHYWERHHLDILAMLLPTTTGQPLYPIATARTATGVGVALCASLLRALCGMQPSTWDTAALGTATACVETLAIAAKNGVDHCAFHVSNDSHGGRSLLMVLQSINHACVSAAEGMTSCEALLLERQRGAFVLATLELLSLLLSQLQCHAAAPSAALAVSAADCVELVTEFVGELSSAPQSVLHEQRWAVAEQCTAALVQCLGTAVVSPADPSGSRPPQESEAQQLLLRNLLLPHSDSAALQDFVIENLAQSLRWSHLLLRQFRRAALDGMLRVVARSLDLLRLALSTPVSTLQRLELYPMSGTTLARRLFSMRTAATGLTNDTNASLIDEIGELCSWQDDGSPAARAVVLAATRVMTVLCRLLGSPEFGSGETPVSAENAAEANRNRAAKRTVGDTGIIGGRTHAKDDSWVRPVSWSIVAALGGPRATQTFVSIAQSRLREFGTDPQSEDLYLATLDLADAAITSRDGLADYYVSPRSLTLTWDKSKSKLEPGDITAVIAKLLHAPSREVLVNDRGCKVRETRTDGEVELEFVTPAHADHAQRIFTSFAQHSRSIEVSRDKGRTVTFSGERLVVRPHPAGFFNELLERLRADRSLAGSTSQRYSSSLELLYNILQHYGDYPPVVRVLLARDTVAGVLPPSAATTVRAVRPRCVQALALSWRIASVCAGIASASMEVVAHKDGAKCLKDDMSKFFEENLEQSVDDMLAIDPPLDRSLQQRLSPLGVAASSFHSSRASVSSVVLNPRFDLGQLLAYVSAASSAGADDTPTERQLLDRLFALRAELLRLSSDAMCYGYGDVPLDGSTAEAEGLVWEGDDEYEQYFFQLSGPILTFYEFRDDGDTRTMLGHTKKHFHVGGSTVTSVETFGVSMERSSYRVELELAGGVQLTLELHPRSESGWERAKEAMLRAVRSGTGYPSLGMTRLGIASEADTDIATAADAQEAAAKAQEADCAEAVRLCCEMERFIGPFLQPVPRRLMSIQSVVVQTATAPLAMGSALIQATTVPQLIANVLAQLTSRVYLRPECPGQDDEIRAQFRKHGRVRKSDLCRCATSGVRWIQYDNFSSAEQGRAANEAFVDSERIEAARCLAQGCCAYMQRKGSAEPTLLSQLDVDLDEAHLVLKQGTDDKGDYARFMGLRSGAAFFSRLTAQEHEHAAELLRAMFALSLAVTVGTEEQLRQKGVFQTRLSTAVATMVGVHVNLRYTIPPKVRARLMRALQHGMLVVTRNPPTGQGHVARLEAAASMLSFLLRAKGGSRQRDGPSSELTVYMRETGSLQGESVHARLGRMFDTIDADSSGEIDQEEGKAFLLSQGVPAKQAEELWRRLLEAADTDGDGRLTKEEWTTGLQVPTVLALAVMLDESLNQAGSVRHRLGRLFDRIDTDRSGFIEEREAKSFLEKECTVPPAFLDQFWQQILEKADIDSDGRVSREEWSSAGTEVFTAAKRSGRVSFASSIVDMTMLLKGATTARHLRATVRDGRVQGEIKDVVRLHSAMSEDDQHSVARLELRNRVVDMSLPAWRFSDSAKLRMSRLFDAIDSDGSGELDMAEWKSFLTEQRVTDPTALEENWKTLVAEVDEDGDGKLTKAEFTEGWLRLFGWRAAARSVDEVFRSTAIPDRSEQVVMLKSATLTQLRLGPMPRIGEDAAGDEGDDSQSTLAQTLRMCTMLFEAAGVAAGGAQHWPLARAALLNLLTVANDLAALQGRDRDGSHAALCGRGEGRDGEVGTEDDARVALLERLLVGEWGERLGADPYEASQLLGASLPSICGALKQLHHIAEDLAHSPLEEQALRQQMEIAFRTGRNLTHSIASSHPMSDVNRHTERPFQIYPCARSGMKQVERGVLILGDGQAAFVPESGSATTRVLMHNIILKASGARGITVTLVRLGVTAGTVLELSELLFRDDTLRAAETVREEAVARHEVWEVALATFASVVRQASDKPRVVSDLVRFDLVRLLCARLGVLQRPEVVVHGDRSQEESSSAWGAVPSAQLGTATLRRSEADTRLALQIMDALMAIADISTGEQQVVHLMVAAAAIPVLSEFVFDDEELSTAYGHDGQRATAHVLWCRILRFVSTLLRISLAEGGNETVVQQLLGFLSAHQTRLGLQWTGTEVVRALPTTGPLPRTVWAGSAGEAVGRTCPAAGLAKLGGTRALSTANALAALRERRLSLAWLEEVEAVSRLLTVVGNCAAVWRSSYQDFFVALVHRLVDTVRIATIVLQADPVKHVARSSSGHPREESGTLGRSLARQGSSLGRQGSASSSASSRGSRGRGSSRAQSRGQRPSRHRSRQSRQSSKAAESPREEADKAAQEAGMEGATSFGVYATDLFVQHRKGEDERVGSVGSEGSASEQRELGMRVHEGLLTVIRSAMHCLRALSPPPLPSGPQGGGALALFALPSAAQSAAVLPPLRELQQLVERFSERRFSSLLREQSPPLSCYHQGADESLYRSVAFQLNAELLEDPLPAALAGDGAEEGADGSAATPPWWQLADNDPEVVLEKVDMVLGLLQIFDKADADGSGRLEESECKELLRRMFDDDRAAVIDDAWHNLQRRVTKSAVSRRRSRDGSVETAISRDEWVHVWVPPADPAEDWVPLRPYVPLGGLAHGAPVQQGRAKELLDMFRLKGRAKMDVFQEMFEELAKYAGARGPGGKPVQVVDSEALRALPRALDLERVLDDDDVSAIRTELKLEGGGKLTIGAWKAWLQGGSPTLKRIMRLKNEQLADHELFDVVEQMRSKDADRFSIADAPLLDDVSFDVARDTNLLLAIAYTYNRPVQVFAYSSRCIFDSDDHAPHTQQLWCTQAADAARTTAQARGADWSTVQLNARGKEREPIRLSIHLFGRPRYAAVLRAAPVATDAAAEALVDRRVVRLLACGDPARTSVRLHHWLDSWRQIEDGALWCLLGHVWQLAKPSGVGEAEARQAAAAATRRRKVAEEKLWEEQVQYAAGTCDDAEWQRLEAGLAQAVSAEIAAAQAAVALAPWIVDARGKLDELAALLRALPPSRAARRETRRMELQAGVAVPGVASQWVAPDGSDPMDRMLVVLEPAIAQLAHLAAKATTTIQSRGGGAQQQAAAAAGDRAAWGQQLTAVSAWQPQTLNTKASSV